MNEAAVVHDLKSFEHLQSYCDYGLQLELSFVNHEHSLQIDVVFRHNNIIDLLVIEISINQQFWEKGSYN